VSWQLGSFLLLSLALVAGFGWYERSRPPSQIVALVAVLAALAIGGRLAFAAIPNVKPTTDIVLIAGYALGAAPGFAVGALTALVSNFAFGQGPWTPWQMAGWGLVGVLGAVLAAAFGRRLGRVPLAIACGLAALGYGAVQNLSLMVTFGGEQTLHRFLAISGASLAFDLAHAISSIVFALLAGPALVRMLIRFRRRFEVRWQALATPACFLLALVLAGTALAGAPARADASAARARAWLVRSQNPDGGYGAARGQRSSTLFTTWAALGLEAAGRDPLGVLRHGHSPLSYLTRSRHTRDIGELERTVLAVAGAGVRPSSFFGFDPLRRLVGMRRNDGSFGGFVNLTAFALFAQRAAHHRLSRLRSSVRWILKRQNRDGGWAGFGAISDVDTTGTALQALALAGQSGSRAARRGVAYLREAQRPGGGFGQRAGDPPNSQSTSFAVSGLIAAEVDPAGVRQGGRSPFAYLAARQARDGHYRYSADTDQTPVWVTGQVLIAVSRETLPVSPPRQRRAR
jgi:energy-coupling factor transport system substrate-specific component